MKKESLKIIEWLQNHPLIMITGIAKSLKINRGNFSTYIKKNKSIPDAYIKNVVNLLKEYGYEDKAALQNVVHEKTTPPQIYTKLKSHGYMGVKDLSSDVADNTSAFVVAPKNENAVDDAKKEVKPIVKPEINSTFKPKKDIPAGLDRIAQMRWLRENN